MKKNKLKIIERIILIISGARLSYPNVDLLLRQELGRGSLVGKPRALEASRDHALRLAALRVPAAGLIVAHDKRRACRVPA